MLRVIIPWLYDWLFWPQLLWPTFITGYLFGINADTHYGVTLHYIPGERFCYRFCYIDYITMTWLFHLKVFTWVPVFYEQPLLPGARYWFCLLVDLLPVASCYVNIIPVCWFWRLRHIPTLIWWLTVQYLPRTLGRWLHCCWRLIGCWRYRLMIAAVPQYDTVEPPLPGTTVTWGGEKFAYYTPTIAILLTVGIVATVETRATWPWHSVFPIYVVTIVLDTLLFICDDYKLVLFGDICYTYMPGWCRLFWLLIRTLFITVLDDTVPRYCCGGPRRHTDRLYSERGDTEQLRRPVDCWCAVMIRWLTTVNETFHCHCYLPAWPVTIWFIITAGRGEGGLPVDYG